MGRIALLLLCMAAFSFSASAEVDQETVVQGLAKVSGVTRHSTPSHVTGTTVSFDDFEIVEETHIVPLKQGITMAIEYDIYTDPSKSTRVREIVQYPEGGLTNPETGINKDHSYVEWYSSGFERGRMSYSFFRPWVIVPGTWTFIVEVDGEISLKRKFFVVAED